ncbi:GtrA family protein [Spirosoma endophyticum]|uniref:Putative flippase GtrA (Transmembrane translocase of bactoprenol-linked glucose) n=1 Tax=Spirosoma endophyticum TaxID=662367 RepID=A0A1I1HX97_9BACT|nr:GtrA family protein [Spirosoma endophyticum]SFC25580.1 Putative flippase GtrA (transmembrane translocase of bactoprenol-linked glucose) [Spirosoma endophyticum]
MRTFFKVQATSLLASGIDFLTTVLCVQLWHYWYLSASVTGAVVGGLVSFIVSKKWTFAESRQPVASQFSRFVLVWLGNAGANATGLFVTTHFLGVQYLVAKTVVGILVGISYNYFLQKDFVFTMS